MCLSEGKEEKRKRRRAQQKNNHTRETTTQEQNPHQPDKGQTEPNPDQTIKGEAGKAKEDRSREGRAYRIRVAIVQLSGDQWGTRNIIMMNTSAW